MVARKRVVKRRVAKKATVPRGVRARVTAIKRSFQDGTISSNTSISRIGGSYAYALNQLPGYTDFTNLFDQYRILKIRVDFVPNLTGNTAPGQPTLYSIFHMATDPTDIGVPNNANDVLQYENRRTVQPYRPFSATFRPSPSAQYFNTLTTSGYGPRPGAWIDSSSPGVQHYGVKYVWDCNAATATQIVPYVTMWCEFKEAH